MTAFLCWSVPLPSLASDLFDIRTPKWRLLYHCGRKLMESYVPPLKSQSKAYAGWDQVVPR